MTLLDYTLYIYTAPETHKMSCELKQSSKYVGKEDKIIFLIYINYSTTY